MCGGAGHQQIGQIEQAEMETGPARGRGRVERPAGTSRQFFGCHWNLKPDERGTVVMAGRECQEARLKRAYGESYLYAGKVSIAAPIDEFPLLERILETVSPWFTPYIESNMEIGMDSGAPMPTTATATTATATTIPAASASASASASGTTSIGSLVNWYAHDMKIGAHCDDESSLVQRSPVVSLSWGHTRTFALLPVAASSSSSSSSSASSSSSSSVVRRDKVVLELGDGDLVIMGGATQTTHKHEIRAMRAKELAAYGQTPFKGRRINLTFRLFRRTQGGTVAGRKVIEQAD